MTILRATCSCCGKPLSDPISMEIGMGPVCRQNIKLLEAANNTRNLFGDRADYDYTVEDGLICIVDNDRGPSVTNDVHEVIGDLMRDGLDLAKLRVIYRDSMGIWDEIVVSNGQFAGFKSLNCRQKAEAKQKALLLDGCH